MLNQNQNQSPAPRTAFEVVRLVAAGLAVACFFLPITSFSTELFSYSFSAADARTGLDILGIPLLAPAEGLGLLLVLPIAAIVLSLLLSRNASWRNVPLLVADVLLIVFCIRWAQAMSGYDELSLGVGFYGYLVCGLVMLL